MPDLSLPGSFELLVNAMAVLSLEEKRKLVNILEDSIFEAEEDFEHDLASYRGRKYDRGNCW